MIHISHISLKCATSVYIGLCDSWGRLNTGWQCAASLLMMSIRIARGVSMSRRYSNDFNDFYHSSEWRAVRLQVLERDRYLCQPCKRAGRITPAKTVDHIEPLRTNWSRRLDLDNLETICGQCHNAKHIERTQTRDKKRQRQDISRRDDVITFGRNPEVY